MTTPNRVLRVPEVLQRLGISQSTLRRMIQREQFPKPMSITGSRGIGWTEHVFNPYLAHREREAKQ
jgi:prophage regulatory protein